MSDNLINEIVDMDHLSTLKSFDEIKESSLNVYNLQKTETPTVLGLNLYELDEERLKKDLDNLCYLNTESRKDTRYYKNNIRSLKPTKRKIDLEIDLL